MGENKGNFIPCTHQYNGEKDGLIVYFDCGLVIDNFTFEHEHNYEHFSEKTSPQTKRIKNSCELLQEIHCKNIISKQLLDTCIFYVKKWEKDKIPYKKNHAYFAIYYCSRLINFPISLKEIIKTFDIHPKAFSKLEKVITNVETISIDFYIEKYCAKFEIPFNKIKEITPVCKIFDKQFNVQPLIIIAVIISLFHPKKSVECISKVMSVSSATIQKWKKKFMKYVNDNNLKLFIK
jgi:transcription initiation factor TFIIIB Brf1 subunit/transcription initiation factor TFIIB